LPQLVEIFSWLLSEQQIAYNPASTLQLPKQPQRLPRGILTKTEARRLIEATPAVKPRDIRDRAILETLYATGIRRAELIALTLYDADLQTATLRVTGKGRRERTVPLTQAAIAALKLYLEEARAGSSVKPVRCVCLSQLVRVVHSMTLTSCALSPRLLTGLVSESTSRRTRRVTPAPLTY
jgi:site-specific recombinase XerD